MLPYNKHLLTRLFFILIALIAKQVLFAQTTTYNFDSSLQEILQEKNDTARLGRLTRMKTANLTPKQKIKLNQAILPQALALKVDSVALQAYLVTASSYMALDDYTLSLKNYLSALAIAEKSNNYDKQAETYTYLAWLYTSNKTLADPDKAIEYI